MKRGNPDFLLLFLTLLLVGFGLVMVAEASSIVALREYGDAWYFTKRQTIWAAIGLAAMGVAMNIPYKHYQKWVPWLTLASLLLLIAVLIPGVGTVRGGARSWFDIGSLGIQPAEFAKLGLILYLAALIAKKEERMKDFKTGLLPALIVVFLFGLLIMMQPDFGGAAILMSSALAVVLCGGARLKHLLWMIAPILAVFSGLALISDHARGRLTSFLNPWADPYDSGYQLIQSLYAFANGELAGRGFGQSIQKFDYLIYPQNDFIFAVIGEEFGFLGVFLFFVLYLSLLWRALILSLRSQDTFGILTGVGIVSLIAIQALINIGGVTGSIPITGVTLPLISYGGSSLVVTLIGIGIVLSISREANRHMDYGS